ncbi:MAG: heme ABC transporter ATP-binding protein [Telmatospirillum sp.]|nr:heme ABC transporter ATP-binding protein [Telmatospirillum sp.]
MTGRTGIRLAGVSVDCRGRLLLDRIDLALEPGRTTVVVGPNGAGKTTLLKVLSGEIRPTRGTVLLDGRPLAEIGPRRLAARRALLSQANETAFGFTVRQLAGLGFRLLETPVPVPRRAVLVQKALDHVGLAGFEDREVGRLSGGERQRAHLARVLVQLWAAAGTGAGLLLLDEPTAAQDLVHQLRVLEIARGHAEAGGTVCVVLHDLNWAAGIGDRMLVLSHGRIHSDGPPADVLTQAMLADVFGVDIRPCAVPPPGRPFIVPQLAGGRPSAGACPSLANERRAACISP